MASFLSPQGIQQYSGYQSQLPTNYVELGLYKQQQYNIGLEKTENYLNSLSGLEVIRDADQQYLNNKINSLTTEINKNAQSMDFSNKSIVNGVGAMASKIYADPIIQNALSGTLQYKSLLANIQETKKSGKGYSVQNEWDALSSVQGWLSDPTPGAQYTGKSYSPHVDVNAKVLTYFKDKKPNWVIDVDPMAATPTDGGIVAYTMVEGKREYIDPALVKQELQAILQPEDYNQLDINGRYGGRMFTDSGAYLKALEMENGSSKKAMQAQIDGWKSQLQKEQNSPRAIQQLNGYIKQKEAEIENADRSFNTYRERLLQGDLEGVKSSMYTDNYLNGWASNLGYSRQEISYKESPLFKSILDQQKAQRDHEKNLLDMEKTRAEIDKLRKETKFIGTKRTKGDGSEEEEGGVPFIPTALDNTAAQNLSRNFMADTEVMRAEVQNQQYKTLYDHMLEVYDNDEEKLSSLFNTTFDENGQAIVRPKKGKEEQVNLEYKKLSEAYAANPLSVTPSVRYNLEQTDTREKVINARTNAANKIAKEADKMFGLQSLTQGRYTIDVRLPNETFSYTPNDLVDINRRVFQNETYGGNLGAFAPENVRTFQSPKEQFAIQTIQKWLEGTSPLNTAEQGFIDNLNDTRSQVNQRIPEILSQRQEYINQNIRPFTQYERAFTQVLPGSKPEERRDTRALIQTIYDQVAAASGGEIREGLTRSTFAKYLANDDTTYRILYNPDGSRRVEISNSEISNEVQSLTLDSDMSRALNLTINDPVRDWRQLMGVNRTPTGGAYTGKNFNDALLISNPYLQKYSAKFNVQQDSNGALSVKLYIYDKNSQQWVSDKSPIVRPVPSLEDAYRFINSPELDTALDQLLKPTDGVR